MKTTNKSLRHLAMCLIVGMLSWGFFMTASAEYYDAEHTFTTADIQGDFDGNTVANDQSGLGPIICTTCEPMQDKSGVALYPIDNEFGFYVEDFVGAAQKHRDGEYTEGYVADLDSGGVMISNAATDKFKVKYPMGTWCAGLGSNSVKCSTERYVVLEHLMTCYESNPYMYYDFDNNTQRILTDPETGEVVGDCSLGKMDNALQVVVDGVPSLPLTALGGAPDMPANESTVLNDIAVSSDYGMTKKDDGKPLYRFGNMIKRPNDVRLYAQLPLPAEWKVEGADYAVNSAELIIEHLITNNPNDQIRPEDMENEGAIGRLPRRVDLGNGVWTSTVTCFEGDGDLIDVGTIMRDLSYSVPAPADGEFIDDPMADPLAFSADLREGYTNAWYTTTDREPFEWSYDTNGDGSPDYSSITPTDMPYQLLSGPRWRLRPNKFGQDIPGLEIPVANNDGSPSCRPVPYTSEFIKYDVGSPAVTTINLLDFEDLNENGLADDSPLLRSTAWVDASQNFVNLDAHEDPTGGNGISINGLPLTPDFDLAVYIKGDRKPTALYTAKLVIDWGEDGGVEPPPVTEDDLSLDSFKVSKNTPAGKVKKATAYVSNAGTNIVNGTLTLHGAVMAVIDGTQVQVALIEESQSYTVAPGGTTKIKVPWTAPAFSSTINWSASIDDDADLSNNTLFATTRVR